jgi:F-box/leucine-rich repeat protein 13
MEDDDIFGRGSGEARDDISMLPTRVAIKVIDRIEIDN